MVNRRGDSPNLDRRIVFHVPGPETVDDYGQRNPGAVTDHRVWAGRLTLPPTDSIELGNTARLTVNLARYVVRWNPAIVADITMTDENGATRTILGVQPLDRRRFLDLLAESIS